MVKPLLTIGIISIQGAISEHNHIMQNTFKKNNNSGIVKPIKYKEDLEEIDGLIIPGGESTTISRFIKNNDLHDLIIKKNKSENLPIMGTCAGCVLLAKKIIDDDKDIQTLGLLDISVERNAFGRQKQSFEKNLQIKGFTSDYNAVFIRAPVIKTVKNNCEILSKIDDKIVMVEQKNVLGLSFHPELTDDLRIHNRFLKNVKKEKNKK